MTDEYLTETTSHLPAIFSVQ